MVFCNAVAPMIYKKSLFSAPTEPLLVWKRGSFVWQKWLYSNPKMLVWLRHPLHTFPFNSIICCLSAHCRCTLKTREFRTKDFLMR